MFLCVSTGLQAQAGLYAGTAKKIVGKPFKENNPDKLFKLYKNTGGYLLDNSREEFEVWIGLYQKENIHLVVMYSLDTVSRQNRVLDILGIKLPDALTVIQAGSCSINGEFSIEIIATERKGKVLNGWRALRDKLRFQKMDRPALQKTNCTVEGAD